MNKQYKPQTKHNFIAKTVDDIPLMFTADDLASEPAKPFKITRDGKPEAFANFKLVSGRIARAAKARAKVGAHTFASDMDRFLNDCFDNKQVNN